MNSNLMIFENPEFGAVRSILIDGDPWFVGKDVASSLGYSNHRKALLDHVDVEDKLDGVTIRDPIGRGQKLSLLANPAFTVSSSPASWSAQRSSSAG